MDIKDYKYITDSQLIDKMHHCITNELNIKLQSLFLIIEIEKRGIQYKLGYSSMYDYLTKKHRLSSASVTRRLQAARLIRRHPQIADLLFDNQVTISTLSLIYKDVTSENVDWFMSQIRGKHVDEVRVWYTGYNPKAKSYDRISKTHCLLMNPNSISSDNEISNDDLDTLSNPTHLTLNSTAENQPTSVIEGNQSDPSSSENQPTSVIEGNLLHPSTSENQTTSVIEGNQSHSSSSENQPTSVIEGNSIYKKTIESNQPNQNNHPPKTSHKLNKPIVQEMVKITFMAKPEFAEKLKKVKSLLSNSFPKQITLEDVFNSCMNVYLEKHDPEARERRRQVRVERKEKHDVKESVSTKTNQVEYANHELKTDQTYCGENVEHVSDVTNTDQTCFGVNVEHVKNEINTNPVINQEKSVGDTCYKAIVVKDNHETEVVKNVKMQMLPKITTRVPIPKTLHDLIWNKYGGKCSIIHPNGVKCNSTYQLEIDHIKPVCLGGNNSPDNLRLVCRSCNQQLARQLLGEETMRKYA